MPKSPIASVARCRFYDGQPGEDEIRRVLGRPDLVSVDHAVWLIQNGNVRENFLLDVLRDPQPERTAPVEKDVIFRMREAAAFRLMLFTKGLNDHEGWREAIVDFLGEAPVRDCKELIEFFALCLRITNIDPNIPDLRLNPVAVTKAAVVQRKFEQLIRCADREPVWTAIPPLWQLTTTLADSRRITLDQAFELRHELHAISTLLALYAQTPCQIYGNVAHALSRPATPAVDAQLIKWFHGPFLPEPAHDLGPSV